MIILKKVSERTLEKDVEKHLRIQVKLLGGKAYKFNSKAHRSVPDRIIVWPNGTVHFVEVKTIGGALSAGQKNEIAFLRSLNQEVRVIWTKAGVDKYIKEMRKKLCG